MKPIKIVTSPIAPDGIDILTGAIVQSGVPADARIIYRGRNFVAACPLLSGDEVNVKAFGIPHLINRMAYGWWRGSKAHRSFHNALRLRRLGLPTPEPYAYIEEYTPGRLLRRSYYVSEQLHPDYVEIRHVDRRPDFARLVEALADFIARLHRKGVWMKDLTPGNVMARRIPGADGAPDTYTFSLIDINRMQFGVGDLRPLIRSCGTLLDSEAALTLFAGFYAAALGIDGAEAEDVILRRFRRVNHIRS